MPEKKSLKEKLKFCRGPFIFSLVFMSALIPFQIFDIEPFLTLLFSLVTPVIFICKGFNLQHDYIGFSVFYILVFIYSFFIGLIIEGIFIDKRDRFLLIGLLLFALFLTGFGLPSIGSAREKARRISCAANLKQIGLALDQYARDNNGFYPDKDGAEGLEMLRKNDYLKDYNIYTCSSTLDISGTGKEALNEKNILYHYKGGTKYSSQSTGPMMWDKYKNHNKKHADNTPFPMKNYGNVLLANGKVIHYEGDEWKKFYDANMPVK